MVQGTPCDLQGSETFKLTKFWEELKDKSNLQQVILKINMDKIDVGRGTIVTKQDGGINYERRETDVSRPTMVNESMLSFA